MLQHGSETMSMGTAPSMQSVPSMQSMAAALFAVKHTHTTCRICHLTYLTSWSKGTLCFFCANFLPMRDTRYSILKDIEWYFIKSGEEDRHAFYNQYIDYLTQWCTRFKMGYQKGDRVLEEEMRAIVDL